MIDHFIGAAMRNQVDRIDHLIERFKKLEKSKQPNQPIVLSREEIRDIGWALHCFKDAI